MTIPAALPTGKTVELHTGKSNKIRDCKPRLHASKDIIRLHYHSVYDLNIREGHFPPQGTTAIKQA